MTNLQKLKDRRSSLGTPPAEASDNLSAPEVAPHASPPTVPLAAPIAAPPVTMATPFIDGRSLRVRRTPRTIQFSTKVTPEFDTKIRQVAQRDQLLLTELLELALEAYEKQAKRRHD